MWVGLSESAEGLITKKRLRSPDQEGILPADAFRLDLQPLALPSSPAQQPLNCEIYTCLSP